MRAAGWKGKHSGCLGTRNHRTVMGKDCVFDQKIKNVCHENFQPGQWNGIGGMRLLKRNRVYSDIIPVTITMDI